MKARGGRRGWFDALRRDRLLFAIAGTILLLAGILQPLAEARAAETGKAWVICTIFGAAKPGDPAGKPLLAAAADDCPICLAAQFHSGKVPQPAAILAADAAFPEPARLAGIVRPADDAVLPAARAGDPPPAIRGPPIFA